MKTIVECHDDRDDKKHERYHHNRQNIHIPIPIRVFKFFNDESPPLDKELELEGLRKHFDLCNEHRSKCSTSRQKKPTVATDHCYISQLLPGLLQEFSAPSS